MSDSRPVSFDLTGCELVEETPQYRMWKDEALVFQRLQLFLDGGPAWPFDLRDPAAASAFWGRQASEVHQGVLLEMEVVRVAGHEALRGLFKYRAPMPGSMAMMFVHILWLPFREWCAQINVEAVERGTTGAREAAVMMIEGPPPPVDEAPIQVTSMEDMFQKMRERPLRVLSADDAKYDAMFPDHPLSQVRRRMAAVMDSLVVDAVRCEPYRLAPAEPVVPAPSKSSRPWWKFGS